MLVISGIVLFTSRDIGYLGNLVKGIFSNFLKGYGILSYLLPGIKDTGTPYTSLIHTFYSLMLFSMDMLGMLITKISYFLWGFYAKCTLM